jgi:predicted porin
MNAIKTALLATAAFGLLATEPARADDYTDLLDILHARGSLSATEYHSLLNKHLHGSRGAARHRMSTTTTDTVDSSAAEATSRRDALAAAASAAQANAAMQKMTAMEKDMETSPDIVHVQPYKPGTGVTMRVGNVDLNFSGIVNGFYTFSSADNRPSPAGGLTDASGFDSSSIRNGLLPGAFIFTAATQQEGIDVSATFGVYPGINSSNAGVLGANTGGNATALGTAGGDFRKMFLTVGTKSFGTVKIGRDIAIFGSDAILNDATLLSVGATGGNADPANTALGRIGYGYIYADFLPQITYISPVFAGFQASIGAIQPLNEVNLFTGGLSGTSNQHSSPEFEGKLTYDWKGAAITAHAWAGFMVQNLERINAPGLIPAQTNNSKTAAAGEAGATLGFGPAALTAYYYKASGVGTTAKFFDGISFDGALRASEGGYIQGSYKVTPKFKLVGSYGESSLYNGAGDIDPSLVRRNEAYVAAGYYTLTDWVTLVGEYAHQQSKSHGTLSTSADAVTAGAILFY